jgi:hypothetical protein
VEILLQRITTSAELYHRSVLVHASSQQQRYNLSMTFFASEVQWRAAISLCTISKPQ